jgi:hypothetical protein
MSAKPTILHLIERRALPPEACGYDYTTDLMRKLLEHAGLGLEAGQVVYWTTPEEVVAQVRAAQPNLVVLWEPKGGGAMLRALSGGAYRKVDELAGYVWRSELLGGTKCLVTYAPSRLKVEWGLTGVVRFHMQRAAREGRSGELVVPELRIYPLMPNAEYTKVLFELA